MSLPLILVKEAMWVVSGVFIGLNIEEKDDWKPNIWKESPLILLYWWLQVLVLSWMTKFGNFLAIPGLWSNPSEDKVERWVA